MAQDEVKYQTVAIGGSAGSLDVLLKIVPQLPTGSGASFVIVVHRKNDADSILVDLLSARTRMNVKEVEDKEPILPNVIYIAPPDYHLLFEDKASFSLDSSEKVHYSRPSIDVTFESVADTFHSSSIGILLSGANADGAEGLARIKQAGGFTIAQDPATADVAYMPQQAIYKNAVAEIAAADAIAGWIRKLLARE